jgi:hypothetical protein
VAEYQPGRFFRRPGTLFVTEARNSQKVKKLFICFREFGVSVIKKVWDSSGPYASSKRVGPGFAISSTPDR